MVTYIPLLLNILLVFDMTKYEVELSDDQVTAFRGAFPSVELKEVKAEPEEAVATESGEGVTNA